MFTRKRFLLVIIAALLVLSGTAQAQSIKVGVVNVSRLVGESPQGATVNEELAEEFAPRQREVVALQNKLQARQEQIQRDIEVMGPEERRNAERDLRRDERELVRSQQEFQEDVNLRRNEVLGKLQRELLSGVQNYAVEQGYDLIISEGVLYASTAIDITEQVLTRLKANFAGQPADQ